MGEASEHTIRTMERDDMLQLYKETVTESQRLEKTVQQLQYDKEDNMKKISEYVARNQGLQQAEEKAIQELRQQQMNVSALKTQVSQLVARLQETHHDVEEKTRRERELERDVYMGGKRGEEIETRRAHTERELLLVKAELGTNSRERAVEERGTGS